MAMFSVNAHRKDPYRNFKFRVLLDGKVIPGISRISPLTRKTEPVTHRNGGDVNNEHQAPGTTTFEPVVLERGLSHDTTFEDWANQVYSAEGDGAVSLKNYRRSIVIQLLNLQGTVVMAFHVDGCWVTEYQALPELDANGSCVAIERIVLAHEGWARDKDVGEPEET